MFIILFILIFININRTTSKEIAQAYDTKSYFTISNAPNVILDTVKRAEDSDEIILRLYEAYGGHAKATLTRCVIKALKIA